MRTKLSILLFLACTAVGFTQTQLTKEQQLEFTTKVHKTAKETKSIISDFTQTKYLDILNDAVVSSGKLYYSAPANIRWEYVQPESNVVIFKENALWVTNNGRTEKINLASNKLFKSFNSLIVNSITGTMFDEEQFTISYFKISAGYEVKFIPKEKRLKRFIAAFELTFTENTGEVTKVKLIEPNDDYTIITLNNRHINKIIAEEKFKL